MSGDVRAGNGTSGLIVLPIKVAPNPIVVEPPLQFAASIACLSESPAFDCTAPGAVSPSRLTRRDKLGTSLRRILRVSSVISFACLLQSSLAKLAPSRLQAPGLTTVVVPAVNFGNCGVTIESSAALF